MAPRPREGDNGSEGKVNGAQDWTSYDEQLGKRWIKYTHSERRWPSRRAHRSIAGRSTGRIGSQEGNPTTAPRLKKRDALQKEIARKNHKIQTPSRILSNYSSYKHGEKQKSTSRNINARSATPDTHSSTSKSRQKCQTIRKT